MRLQVIRTSLGGTNDWLFELEDENETYYIYNSVFYAGKMLPCPVNRIILDSLFIGHWVDCDIVKKDGFNIVVKINKIYRKDWDY